MSEDAKTYKARRGGGEFKQFPDKLEKLKELFEKMGSKHDRALSNITVTNYVNKLNKLSTIVLGHGYNGSNNWLTDSNRVIGALRKHELSGKKDFLSPVVKLLKHIDAPQDIISAYQKAMSEFKDDEYSVRRKNKASQEHVDKALPYEEIIQKINDYKVVDDTTLIYKLICAMYFQNTLVPRNDLPTMKLVSTSKKVSQMNPEFNYITIDKAGTPIDVIMKNYKSRATYGTQKFPITDVVKALLKQYFQVFGKRPGDFLFVMRDGQPFKKPNFIDLIGNATEAVLGKRMSADIIRQIQITHYYNQHAKSIEEDEHDSLRYLHSSAIHKEYLRTNLPQGDSD